MPIADYKQFLNLRANRPFHLGYYAAKAGRAVAPDPTDGMPNPTMLTCGDCDLPYLMHSPINGVTDPFGDSICSRKPSSFFVDSDRDYYADTMLTVLDSQPAPYYEQNKDQDCGIDYDYALDTWRDEAPVVFDEHKNIIEGEFTSATSWWTGTLSGTYAANSQQAIGNLPTNAGQSRKGSPVIVDGTPGFVAVEVFDPTITERLNLSRFYNFYVDKNTGDQRLGGLVLSREGSIFSAKCVRNDWTTNRCHAPVLSIDADAATYDQMIDFTLNLIRHSNNHAAPWFTKRDTFYKIHHEDCDLLCDAKAAHCDIDTALDRKIAVLANMLNFTETTTLKVAS